MPTEMKTFYLKSGEGKIDSGWTPVSVTMAPEGSSVWVHCKHQYSHPLDSLLRKEKDGE